MPLEILKCSNNKQILKLSTITNMVDALNGAWSGLHVKHHGLTDVLNW